MAFEEMIDARDTGTLRYGTEEGHSLSQDHHLQLLERFPVLIWQSGTDGLCNHFNHTWLEFTGRTIDQELGNGWIEGVHPDDLPNCMATYLSAFNQRRPFAMEYRLRYHDGSYRWITDHGSPFNDRKGNFSGYIGGCLDINFQKEAELELREAREQLEQRIAERTAELQTSHDLLTSLSQQVPGVIFQFRMMPDGSLRIPYASESIRELYQIDPEEVAKNADILLTRIHPDDYAPFIAAVRESAHSLQPLLVEFRMEIPGNGMAWRSASAKPQRLNDGSYVWHGFSTDITERKRMDEELRDSRAQLNLARTLESIGQLAAGVAHEVRNPLNAILSITEALFKEHEIESNPEFDPYLQHIRTQVKRLAHLMNELLDLGKPIPASSLQPILLYELCCDVTSLWKSSGAAPNKQLELTSDQTAVESYVMADSMKLQQVLFNLLENAGYHSPIGSTISFHLHPPDDGAAVIRVMDAGAGVPEDKLDRIFDPFYSDRKGGTGLGLALVKHFIEHMGGCVKVWNNQPAPGCIAEIRIPLAGEVAP